MAILALLVFFLMTVTPARVHAAPLCRQIGEHQVCILSIKRSAKNYWEYRASVKIDEVVRPVEGYNCRDRTHTLKTGRILPFDPQGAGPLICQLLHR